MQRSVLIEFGPSFVYFLSTFGSIRNKRVTMETRSRGSGWMWITAEKQDAFIQRENSMVIGSARELGSPSRFPYSGGNFPSSKF